MASWLWLWLLLFSFSFICPAFTSDRSPHFSQELIQVLHEPDPDATNLELSFDLVVETTSVELHDQEPPFSSLVSENDDDDDEEASPFLVGKPSISLDPDSDLEEPDVPSYFGDSSIASILDQNGLPIGLLPSSVESYSLSDDGQFSVSLSKACYVDFDYEVYYAQTITGTLSYGAISDLSGIQAKKAFLWLSVTGIHADDSSSSYIYFDVGPFSRKLSISQFESVPVCKDKAINLSTLA